MDRASTPRLRGASIHPVAVEREYQARFLPEDGKAAAVIVMVMAAIFSIFIRSDHRFISDGSMLRTVYFWRGAFLVLTFAVAWVSWNARRPAVMQAVVVGWAVATSALTVAIGSTRPPDYYVTFGGDMVVVMLFWAALPNRFLLQAVAGLAMTAGSMAVLARYRLPVRPEAIRLILTGYVGINLLGAFLSWRSHRSRRILFLEQRSLIAAQESIRKTSLRLALAMEGGQFGAWDWIVGEPTTTVSRRWREIVGVPGEGDESACENRAWIDAIHPDDVPRVTERARALVEGREDRYDQEYRLPAADGSWKWVRSRGRVVARDPDGRALRVAGTLADVTARKVEEQRLRASEERLREAQRISHVGNWDLDLRTMTLSWSDEVYRIFEVDRKVFGASYDAFLAAIHPEDRAAVNAAYTRSVEAHVPYEVTHRLLMPDGRVKHVQEHAETFYGPGGKPLRSMGTVQDVTERTLAENATRESQGLLAAIFQSTTDLIWSVDAESFGILTFNRGIEDYFRLARGIVLKRGDRPEDLFPPGEYVERWRTMFQAAVRDGSYRTDYVTYAGTIVLDLHLSAIRDGAKVTGIAIFGRNVTEQRRVEAQLRQAQKLESIGRLAGGVAHDFNNFLSVILTTGEELREALAAGRPADPECVDDILGAGRRAAALTRQLLLFARKERLEPELLDVGAAVRDSRKLFERLIGEGVRIEEHHGPDPWKVRCDPGLVGQVVMNLMLNARDAMPGGGTLTLSTGNFALGRGEEPPAADLAPGEYVRLTVRDTGQGMTQAVMEHLFEPFFSTKGPGRGTGLGLATVYGIVKQSGGAMSVRSAPGEGATFEIYFPRALDAPAATASPAAPSSS